MVEGVGAKVSDGLVEGVGINDVGTVELVGRKVIVGTMDGGRLVVNISVDVGMLVPDGLLGTELVLGEVPFVESTKTSFSGL
jgi:hypothetical protein